MSVTDLYPSFLTEDLVNSGLEPSDVRARLAGPGEKQATNTPLGLNAYVLPYFDLDGKQIPFYRTKIVDGAANGEPKYKQLATSSNHVYFPLGFSRLLPSARYILVTEGEKKAACAVKNGIPCIGLSGVDSWRNRTVVLHKDSQVGTDKKGQIVAKLPQGAEVTEKIDTLATGLQEIIDFVLKRRIPLVMCFDSDLKAKDLCTFDVQRGAAQFGYELRYRGIPFPQIRQLILKPVPRENAKYPQKLGLDDFLMHENLGQAEFDKQLTECLQARSAFPKHPNPRQYVNRKLQRSQIPRSELQAIANSIICDLDSKGLRLYCPDDDNMYYFDEEQYKLMKVQSSDRLGMAWSKTPFGIRLYNDYSLTTADVKVLQVLNAQFCGEQPIATVKPERVLTIRGNNMYFQISDGLMVKVNAQGIKVLTNGSEDILFEGDMVLPVPHQQLMAAVQHFQSQETLDNFWYPVLKDARFSETTNDYGRKLLALLYNISPYFYRWRGTQLPIEMMTGEAGSGKSTLYELRLNILTGIPVLRNAPSDVRDWTASIAATGGLHVTDNVHMVNSKLKQELSDELCRIITEPNPHIERRKLYSDNELIRTPVKCVFAVTAIQQPFTNTDIIQRSIIAELDKGTDEVEYDADWQQRQLGRFGGRTYWLAHQFVFVQRMFQLIEREWQEGYRAKFRLINIEQLLSLSAKVFGWESEWVPHFLEGERDRKTATSDAALEGLIIWADLIRANNPPAKLRNMTFTAQDMVYHFEGEEGFEQHPLLTNARKLGHYLAQKKNTISTIAGIVPTGLKSSNRITYRVVQVDHE